MEGEEEGDAIGDLPLPGIHQCFDLSLALDSGS